jgi:hypothetical protein
MKKSFGSEFLDGFSRLKGWVELNKRLWPKCALYKTAFCKTAYLWISDLDEGRYIGAILIYKAVPEFKYVHSVNLNAAGGRDFWHGLDPHSVSKMAALHLQEKLNTGN